MAGAPVTPGGSGVVTDLTRFPQWGAGGGTPGSAAGWKVVKAADNAQKLSYEKQGYLIWFPSQSAAQGYVASESSPLQSGEPQNAIPGLTQIGDFFGALTQSNTWIRVAKVIAGGALLVIGLAHITGAGGVIGAAARKVPA